MSDDASLNVLDMRKRRGPGVRRLNRVPLMIATALLLLILGAVLYTYQMRLAEMRRQAAEAEIKPEPAKIGDLFTDAPDAGLIEASRPFKLPSPEPALSTKTSDKPVERRSLDLTEAVPAEDPAWAAYQRQLAEMAARREKELRQALASPTKLRSVKRPVVQTAAPRGQVPVTPSKTASLFQAQLASQRQLLNAENGNQEEDINRAAEKRAFLSDRSPRNRDGNYLQAGLEAPVSPFEIKAGTVIPAIMVGGVLSDLPGQIIGQVSENVYDTATGRHILIPQGAKLVGTYDNAVTTGQDRVLVAWTRIIYPDASSVDLGKMPGTDASGLAGFSDKVNNHYWRMFGSALLMSIVTAGVQISQGGVNTGNGLDAQQTIAAGLGQQFGQLGQEIARRNSRIQPTLEIRPGYRFSVMVTKDMVLRPWLKK